MWAAAPAEGSVGASVWEHAWIVGWTLRLLFFLLSSEQGDSEGTGRSLR